MNELQTKILNSIIKEQGKINGLKIDDISSCIVYLSDNNKNSYAARLTATKRYKKDSFHLMRSFLEMCYG